MCGNNPQTMQSLSTATSVLGTLSQMKTARANAAYQASVANTNAALAERQAVAAGQSGASEQAQIREKVKQTSAAQKTGYAASGLDISSGSPLATLSSTAYQGEQDVQTSRYNTMMNMWGLNQQAANYRSQAAAATKAGKNQATSTLLTGLTSLAKNYQSYNSVNTNTANNEGVYQGGDFSSSYNLTNKDSSGNYFIGNNDYTLGTPTVKKYKSKYSF